MIAVGSISLPAGCIAATIVFSCVSGCTSVTATLADGTKIGVTTFAQSRQNIDIGRDKDGVVYWRASDSSPDQTLTKAISELVGIVAAAPKP